MQIDNIKVGQFFREKRNYLEYWRKFNIIKIIRRDFLPLLNYKVICCRKGNNTKITLAKYSIIHENIKIRFKKAEINYIFKWILENLRKESVIVEED